MSAKTILITIDLIVMVAILGWLYGIATPAIDNFSASPEDRALYELSKKLNGTSAATLAFANSTLEFKPYKLACKTSTDPIVQENCVKISFLVNS